MGSSTLLTCNVLDDGVVMRSLYGHIAVYVIQVIHNVESRKMEAGEVRLTEWRSPCAHHISGT